MATTTPITTKVPAATAEAIADRASQMGISKSQLMSDAIAQYLGPIEPPIEPTAAPPTPAPVASTPEPNPSKPSAMPAKITPDTRLSLERLCELFDIGFVDRGMDGVKITHSGGTEICINRGSAGALVMRLTGWHCYPDASYGPYKPTSAAEFVANPNFVAVGEYAQEGAVIAAYKLELKSPIDGHSPLSRVMAGACNQLTVPQAIAHLTGMAFSHDGTLVSPIDKGSSFMIRLYQRLK
jgi:hypothetical protein